MPDVWEAPNRRELRAVGQDIVDSLGLEALNMPRDGVEEMLADRGLLSPLHEGLPADPTTDRDSVEFVGPHVRWLLT